MAVFPSRKYIFSLLMTGVSVVAVYSTHIQLVGETPHPHFFRWQVGSASSPLDLPIYVIPAKGSSASQTKKPSITIPTSISCEKNQDLCSKIKFTGVFSESDKRKYQSLIIKQVKNIDAILYTPKKLADVLYSITLDAGVGARRWLAGKSTIIISVGNIQSQEEFIEIVTHELWHIIDLSILQGKSGITQKSFLSIDRSQFPVDDSSLNFYQVSWLNTTTRKANAGAAWFVGWYAMSDPFEDFAETFNTYLNHHHVLALLAANDSMLKKKMTFMEGLFNKKYLQSDIATAAVMKDNIDERPRDSTKWY